MFIISYLYVLVQIYYLIYINFVIFFVDNSTLILCHLTIYLQDNIAKWVKNILCYTLQHRWEKSRSNAGLRGAAYQGVDIINIVTICNYYFRHCFIIIDIVHEHIICNSLIMHKSYTSSIAILILTSIIPFLLLIFCIRQVTRSKATFLLSHCHVHYLYLMQAGFSVMIESGAGDTAQFPDATYVAVGKSSSGRPVFATLNFVRTSCVVSFIFKSIKLWN